MYALESYFKSEPRFHCLIDGNSDRGPSKPVVLQPQHAREPSGVLAKMQLPGSHPGVSDSVGLKLGFSPRICISTRFPSDSDPAGGRVALGYLR